jgi:hypothetical protein
MLVWEPDRGEQPYPPKVQNCMQCVLSSKIEDACDYCVLSAMETIVHWNGSTRDTNKQSNIENIHKQIP